MNATAAAAFTFMLLLLIVLCSTPKRMYEVPVRSIYVSWFSWSCISIFNFSPYNGSPHCLFIQFIYAISFLIHNFQSRFSGLAKCSTGIKCDNNLVYYYTWTFLFIYLLYFTRSSSDIYSCFGKTATYFVFNQLQKTHVPWTLKKYKTLLEKEFVSLENKCHIKSEK